MKYIKPGGVVLVRDYATDDMAHVRFQQKNDQSKIEDNFYVRGDGTRAYYFDEGNPQQILLPHHFFLILLVFITTPKVQYYNFLLRGTRLYICCTKIH